MAADPCEHVVPDDSRACPQCYLDGHRALLPDVAAARDEQVRSTEGIAAMAVRLAELNDVPGATPPDPEALPLRTAELVADLAEPARSTPLERSMN
jgi:hypothetical protein